MVMYHGCHLRTLSGPQGQDRVTKVSTTDAGGSAGAGSSHGGPRGSAATVAAALLSYMDHVMKDLDLAVQARCDLVSEGRPE